MPIHKKKKKQIFFKAKSGRIYIKKGKTKIYLPKSMTQKSFKRLVKDGLIHNVIKIVNNTQEQKIKRRRKRKPTTKKADLINVSNGVSTVSTIAKLAQTAIKTALESAGNKTQQRALPAAQANPALPGPENPALPGQVVLSKEQIEAIVRQYSKPNGKPRVRHGNITPTGKMQDVTQKEEQKREKDEEKLKMKAEQEKERQERAQKKQDDEKENDKVEEFRQKYYISKGRKNIPKEIKDQLLVIIRDRNYGRERLRDIAIDKLGESIKPRSTATPSKIPTFKGKPIDYEDVMNEDVTGEDVMTREQAMQFKFLDDDQEDEISKCKRKISETEEEIQELEEKKANKKTINAEKNKLIMFKSMLKKAEEHKIAMDSSIAVDTSEDTSEKFSSGKVKGKGISDVDINTAMGKLKFKGWLGAIASDEIPKLIPKIKPKHSYGFVMNLSTRKQTGTHWVAVYISWPDESIEYFDSFGDNPKKKTEVGLKKIVEKMKFIRLCKYKINKVQHQQDSADSCGFHSMLFLINRFNGILFSVASGYDERIKDKSGKYEKEIKKLKKIPIFGYI